MKHWFAVSAQDLDELREEIEDDEYDEIKKDTKEQLQVRLRAVSPGVQTHLVVVCKAQEIQQQLSKMLAGDVSLVSEFGAMRLALQATIADAFQTPEVIRLFAKKEAPALRARLAAVDQDHKLGKITADAYKYVLSIAAVIPLAALTSFPALCRSQTIEIIVALKKLGEALTEGEKAFLKEHDDAMAQFESADKAIDASMVSGAVAGAAAAT